MIELLLTISFSTLIIVTFRLIGYFKIDELEAIVFNYVFAVLWGLWIWSGALTLQDFTSRPWFSLSLLIGVMYIVTFFLLSRSTTTAGLAVTGVASRMSVVIPVITGFILFGDTVTTVKVAGIILSLFSFYLIFKPEGKVVLKPEKIILPFLLFLGIGTNDTLIKYIQYHYLQQDESLLLASIFFISLLVGIIVLTIRNIREKRTIKPVGVLAGFVLGSLNFGATYYFVRSMKLFESAFLFPVVNAGIVSLVAIIGFLFFNEKLSKYNWIGILTAVVAIIMISRG